MEKIYHSFYGVVVETGEAPENPSVNEQNPEEGEGSEAPSGDNETPVINDDNTGEEIGDNTDGDETEDPAEVPAESETGASIMSVDGMMPMAITEHKVTYTESDDYTVALEGGVENGNQIIEDPAGIVFTVTPAEHKTIKSVKWSVGEVADSNPGTELTGEEDESLDEGAKRYTISADKITDEAITADIVLTIEVEAKTYTVTVTKSAAGIKKVTYLLTQDNTEPNGESTALGESLPVNDITKNLKIYVEPDAGYSVTVKKGDVIFNGHNNVYNLGCITKDINVTIEAEKTGYEVKSSVVRASGETTETIADAVLSAVKVKWGKMVTASGEAGAETYTALKKYKDLTFTLDGLGDLKAAVYYGGTDTQTTLIEPQNGTYTVSMDDVAATEGFTVKVEVRNVGKSKITMAANTDVKALTYKNDAGAYVAIGDGPEIKEDQKFEFKVEANEFFKVTEVTAATASGEEVAVSKTADGKDTVYSLVAANENITITVTTELDAEQCYRLQMNVDGDKGSVTAAVTKTADGTEADTPALNGTLPAEDPIVTRNAKVQVVLTVDSHYDLAAEAPVKLGTETLTATAENTYELTLTKGALATLTVKTERKGLETANTVTFDKDAAGHMTLAVTEVTDQVTKDQANANKYNLAAGVKDIDFTITADGPYAPTVKYSGTKEVKPNGTPVKKDGKTAYTYSLAAVLLGENDTIVITEAVSEKKITVLYDAEDVKVTMKKGALEDVPTEIDGGVETSVTEGDSLTITASALDNCKLDAITKKVGTGEAADLEGFTKGAVFHKFNVTAEDDVTIVITSQKQLSVQPLYDEGASEFMTPNKSKKYDVRYDGTYTARIKNGAVDLALQKVELKKGNDSVPQTSDEGVTNWSTRFAKGDTYATITLGEGLAGTECTLLLYDSAADDAVPVASYPLKVSALVFDKDVKINGGKDISQTADTVNTYKVAVNKDASASELYFEIPTGDANKDVVKSAAINEGGMLEITTGYGAGESAELKVYTLESDGTTKKYVQQGGKDLTVKVTATNLLDKEKTVPSVKQASSTDVSITLSLGAKKIAAPANGRVYYEVKLTPSYVEADHKDKLLPTVPVQYIEKNGDAQEATIYVGAKGSADVPSYGTGAACQYGITVRLVHADSEAVDGTDIAPANVKSESKSFTKDAGKDFATKAPTFETNLKLKKGAGNVYTTQKDVVIATPTFSKDTSYTVLPGDGASDITMGLEASQKLEVKVEDNKIKASATENTALGKHTIQVLATTTDGDTMYASRATIVVTVVRGIEDITLTVPTTSVYYADKAVNLKTVLAFNSGYADAENPKDGVPKTKKVEYKLVDVSVKKASLNTLEAIQNVSEADVVKDGVKIDKSGKISVPRNYKVTSDSKFKVLVKAADFAENAAYDLSDEITITRDYMQIAKALIVKSNTDGGYDVIDADGKELNASELNGAQMMAFETGLPAKTSYTQDELESYQIAKNVTYASSNKKAVEIDQDGYITVNAPAKNVKLTAAPADGSAADRKLNTTQTITTTVKYDDVTELGLEIYKLNNVYDDNTPEKTFAVDEVEKGAPDVAREITYNDSSAATFVLFLKSKENGKWEDATAFTDYKLTASKGKILYVDAVQGTGLAANDKQTILKLTYKVYNAEKKKYDSKTKEYKLTNAGLTAVDAKTKAPKIVFRNKRNTIQANYTTTDKNLETWKKEDGNIGIGSRYIGFNLQPNGRDYPLDFVAGKDAEGNDLYVKVDVDWSAMTAKNAETLQTLADSMDPKGYRKLNSDGNYGGYVHMTFSNDATLTPGSYKLKVSVGTVDDNRDFVPAAPSTAITIKVAKDKALSFKPVTSYKISAKDNGYAVLTGKGSYDSVEFSDLQNDNVKGRLRGHENAFTDYFELALDGDGNQILQLKADCFENGKLKEISKDDLTGYVTYTAQYQYTGAESVIKGTTKITVKLEGNTIAKYAVTNATADTAAGKVANVTVTCNKKPVEIAYALVKEADKGTWQVVTKNESAYTPAIAVNNSVISLQHTDTMTDKSAKVTLLVIPADSYYKERIAAVTDDADNAKKKAIIEQYGVELKTTITLNDLTATATNKRISVDRANLAQKFTAEYTEWTNGAESGWYTKDRNYWIDVPYTELYDDATAQIKAIQSDKAWITFDKYIDDGKKRISIALNKDDLQAHFDECYQKKTVKGGTVYQPKKLNVTATVYYGGTQETPAAPSDIFKFALTMPDEPYFMNTQDEEGNVTTDYELAIARVKELEPRISQSIADNMQKYNYYYMQKLTGDDLDESVKGHVMQHLEDHIRSWLGDDCGIDLDGLQDQMTVATGSGEFKSPTSTAAGLVKVTVALTNGNDKEADDSTKKTTNVTFTVNLAPFEAKAGDVKALVEAFLTSAKITNKTTEASLLAELKAYVKENASYDTSKIRYTITGWDLTPAAVARPGSLALKVEIYNIAEGGEPEAVDKTGDDDKLEIPALESAENVVTAVKKAVGVADPDSGTKADVIKELTKTNNSGKTQKAVEDAAKKAIGSNPYVVAFAKKDGTEVDDFTLDPAKKDAPGSLSFKLIVKNEDGTALEGSTGDVVLRNAEVAAIADLLTLVEAETKVNAWITANTLTETDNASTDTKVLKNGVTKEEILAAIKSDTTNKVPETSLIAVMFEDGFKCTDATVNTPGSVKGTLVLTDMADVTKKVTLDVVIPALPQTEAEAVQKIKDAVADAVNKGTIVVTKDTQNEDETVTNAILAAAQNAAGLKTDTFDITVKDGAKLAITAPSGNTAGKATITLSVKAKTNGTGTDCAIEIAIPAETTA